MQNTERDLKLYYSISEVAQMFDVNESLLRFWEKEFPQISPKKGSRGVRQYRKEDVETIRLIYHLVKERGMTLPGARQKLKDNREATIRNFEIIGEASNNIEKRYPELPLASAYQMRNALAHGYFKVDFEIVWKTIQSDLPKLYQQVRQASENTNGT